MTKPLSPRAQKLLNQLVEDYSSTLPPAERVLKVEARASYIYNLFRGNYSFSGKDYNEVFEYLCKLEK